MRGTCLVAAMLSVALSPTFALAAKIYWADSGYILRALAESAKKIQLYGGSQRGRALMRHQCFEHQRGRGAPGFCGHDLD